MPDLDLDLDQLSNEIAATSPDWAVAGVEAIADRGRIARVLGTERPGFLWVDHGGGAYAVDLRDCRPNLRDPVTVNALLGDGGQATYDSMGWMATMGDWGAIKFGKTRTEAICRAWIAAKGKGK